MLKGRNIGIDLLKIVSMVMIVTLHMLGHGRILESLPLMSHVYQTAWLLEILCYGAVNCYALVSGFLLAHCRANKLFELWLQVLFYSVIITVFMSLTFMRGTFPKEDWIYAFFPIVLQKNWYISAYFGMMCFIPFLNLGIEKIDKLFFQKILKGIFFMYILLPVIVKCLLRANINIDPITFIQGYSAIWLCVLYLFGAYIRKYVDYKNIGKKKSFFCFILMSALNFISKMIMEQTGHFPFANVLVDYTSPTVFIGSLALLLFFANVEINNIKLKNIIITLSNATLGVYLLHDNYMIRNTIVSRLFTYELHHAAYKTALLKLIVVVISVYLICSFIDLLRGKFFDIIKEFITKVKNTNKE